MGDYLLLMKFIKELNTDNRFYIDNKSQQSNLKLITQFICHRIPERTFNFRGCYFPVCSRCTGLYIGVFLCLCYLNLCFIDYTINLLIISVLMMIPTFLDGITQFIDFRQSNNFLRLLTGLIAGLGLVIFINTARWIIIMN
jgi:uncharacterized membrane protein